MRKDKLMKLLEKWGITEALGFRNGLANKILEATKVKLPRKGTADLEDKSHWKRTRRYGKPPEYWKDLTQSEMDGWNSCIDEVKRLNGRD